MKISVIIPVYKVEKYLRKCVESVINQTYKNIEIILVDDGSPDDCPKICDEYESKDTRIKVIHKENGGLSDARNKGVEISTGEYVFFVDSDDYLELNAIQSLVENIRDTQADVVCFNLSNVVEKDYSCVDYKLPYCHDNTNRNYVFSYSEALMDNVYRKHIRYEAQSKIYKRGILEKIKFPVGMLAEDFATFYLFLKEANKISYIDSNLYNYVQREGSIMTTRKPKLYSDVLKTEKLFYEEVKQLCKTEEEVCANETRSFRNLAKIYAKLYKTEYHEDAMEANKKIRLLDSKKIKFKYRLMYYIFMFNDKLFVNLFNFMYKKA